MHAVSKMGLNGLHTSAFGLIISKGGNYDTCKTILQKTVPNFSILYRQFGSKLLVIVGWTTCSGTLVYDIVNLWQKVSYIYELGLF